MKYLNYISKIICLLISFTLVSCHEDLTADKQKQSLKIIVNASRSTRIATSDVTTTFTSGDRVGLYCVDGNEVVVSNAEFIFDGTSWSSSVPIEYSNASDYYVYYPYKAEPYTPDFTRTGMENIFDEFLEDDENKFHSYDQSSEAVYHNCDLMIAEGVAAGENTVSFLMQHKKALAIFEGYGILTTEFTGNIPCAIGDKKYFLMKPGEDTPFRNGIISYTLNAEEGHCVRHDIMDNQKMQYLTFEAEEAGTFTFSLPAGVNTSYMTSVAYSLDHGDSWTTLTNSSAIEQITTPEVAKGDLVMWKGVGVKTAISGTVYSQFFSTGKFKISGNIMSLLYENFSNQTELTGSQQYAFNNIFKNCKVTDAGELSLPVMTLSNYCYRGMFEDCSELEVTPQLPARTVPSNAYAYMFKGCISLESTPELKATGLGQNCYAHMFEGCTSLTSVATLPTPVLANGCYEYMFSGCTALVTAPELPATTLYPNCYGYMFQNCTALTTAPDLLASRVPERAYWYMFSGCTSLTTAPVFGSTSMGDYACKQMFYKCTSLTTAPDLPATTVGAYCYQQMFQNCGALHNAMTTLPAMTLSKYCYNSMFQGCSSLTTAPTLPATSLADCCYFSMFQNCTLLSTPPPTIPASIQYSKSCYNMFAYCTNLLSAPTLPATTLAESCYEGMFRGCNYLTTAPSLPATDLQVKCYRYMFSDCRRLSACPALPSTETEEACYEYMFTGCRSITAAPTLAATTLSPWCYANMFKSCTSLTRAPDLKAETLLDNCYREMFYGCSSMDYIKAMFLTTPSDDYTYRWMMITKTGGTFVKNANATWNVYGNNGIPDSWFINTATE